MKTTLKPFMLLLISGFLLMLGYGLSNILLPVRMQNDGVSLDNIGLVLSMLYVGFVLGAYYSRSLLQSVGHIRIFAMCGSLTSVAILLSGLYPEPFMLAGMRILTGFCIACINATLDSWLSDSATEKNRGRILSINQMMMMTALFSGQFLLNVAPIDDITLFVICGILFSLSITPIVISRQKGPIVEDSQSMSLMTVFKLSPLGVISSFYSGFLYAGLINMLPIFASKHGIAGLDLSIFMGAAISGAIILQFPIAYLSDNFDRRKIMLLMVSTLIGLCLTVSLLMSSGMFTLSLLVIALITGLVACFYPMSMAETFETVLKEQILSAMSSLLLIYALGSIVGPYLASVVMSAFGSSALFSFMSVTALTLLLFISVLMKLRHALPVDDQESFIMQTPSGVVSELDPRTHYAEAQFEATAEVEVAISLASKNPSAAVNMVKALVLRDPKNASNLAAALSTIDAIDISQLYAAITSAAPQMSIHIAEALTNASPEQADQLVDWITTEYPDQFTNIVVAIANAMPDDGIDLMALAAENMVEEYPSELLEMTEEYVTNLSDSLDAMRPVDRVAAASENTATELYNRLTDVSPEQSAELAFTVSESLPEASNDVAEAYVQNLIDSESDSGGEHDSEQTFSADALDNIENAANIYVNHMVDNVPEHAVDIASTFVDSFPEVASDMLEILQDSDDIEDSELRASIDDKPLQSMVEQQLQEAVQTQSDDIE
ncbi:MFS transporter [Shewanella surugensis]|uniref:MFS transporter n=1 Tax=Shewanella surugensis TaxID=212020 RepID=A0ABT0L9R3_9GAMM|nr:MFS transporter [Shewanella surugensis]MCL1124299.1 MFS transporter [Shewanella surugensis]